MVFEMLFVRQAYQQALAHELRKIVRTLRAHPSDRLDERQPGCAVSARDLALELVQRVRRIDDIAWAGAVALPRPAISTRGELLLELETAWLGTHAALVQLPSTHWSEVIAAPAEFATFRQARRGELLWLALRELVRHSRHLAQHVRGGCAGGGRHRSEPKPRNPVDEFAASA